MRADGKQLPPPLSKKGAKKKFQRKASETCGQRELNWRLSAELCKFGQHSGTNSTRRPFRLPVCRGASRRFLIQRFQQSPVNAFFGFSELPPSVIGVVTGPFSSSSYLSVRNISPLELNRGSSVGSTARGVSFRFFVCAVICVAVAVMIIVVGCTAAPYGETVEDEAGHLCTRLFQLV